MFKNNKNLLVISLIAIVNVLGYGIVIPVLYTYSQKYGLNDFQNGLLFSLFSICQFISTPIIGHLSDVHGRKPLLIISLLGTVASFFLMAFAPSAIFLFIARALDGITAGNFPVAQAVISDTTDVKDRAKGFGLMGAAFGFGFIFGPAISGLTIGFGSSVPFIIAGVVTLISVILTAVILPETNKHIGTSTKKSLFNLSKLVKALFDENVGTTLLISFIYSFAFGLFIYVYQPVSVKIIHLSVQQIAFNFTMFGLVGLLAQMFVIPRINKRFGEKQILTSALLTVTLTFLGLFFSRTFLILGIVSIFHALGNAFVNPLIQSLLSKEVDHKSQGEILGLNASYAGLGMVFGPIIGGTIATIYIPLPFLLASISVLVCTLLSITILRKPTVAHLS